MEKSKPRGNILSLEVYQGVGDEIIGQQPHHTESHELKQDGSYLRVKPEGYLFWCRAVFKASHLLSKGRMLPEEVSYGSSWEDKLVCPAPVVFRSAATEKKGALFGGHPAERII